MNRKDLESIIATITQKVSDFPKLFWRNNQPQILQLRYTGEIDCLSYVKLDSIELLESCCIFEIMPDGDWIDGIVVRKLILPYSSIIAIEEEIRNDGYDGDQRSHYKMFLIEGIVDEL